MLPSWTSPRRYFFRPLELGMFQATRKDIPCIHTASSASDSAVIRCLNGDIAKEKLPVIDDCLQRGVSEIFVLPVEVLCAFILVEISDLVITGKLHPPVEDRVYYH